MRGEVGPAMSELRLRGQAIEDERMDVVGEEEELAKDDDNVLLITSEVQSSTP